MKNENTHLGIMRHQHLITIPNYTNFGWITHIISIVHSVRPSSWGFDLLTPDRVTRGEKFWTPMNGSLSVFYRSTPLCCTVLCHCELKRVTEEEDEHVEVQELDTGRRDYYSRQENNSRHF